MSQHVRLRVQVTAGRRVLLDYEDRFDAPTVDDGRVTQPPDALPTTFTDLATGAIRACVIQPTTDLVLRFAQASAGVPLRPSGVCVLHRVTLS